jgi:hypothetical protein
MVFSKQLPQGEYLLRSRAHFGQLMRADVLEGKYDGHRLTLRLTPSVMDHFQRHAIRGACWMAKVGGKNVITRLAFLGREDDPYEWN